MILRVSKPDPDGYGRIHEYQRVRRQPIVMLFNQNEGLASLELTDTFGRATTYSRLTADEVREIEMGDISEN